MSDEEIDASQPIEDRSVPLPTSVGTYALQERLGVGRFGSVFKAQRFEDQSFYAVKLLNSQFSTNPDVVARFRREARVLASLQHPNIVRFYEADEWDGVYYIVTEYVDGSDVLRYVNERHLSPNEAASIVQKAAEACHWAHTRELPIIHRDIKPANILIETATGRVLLSDFGLAKQLGAPSASSDTQKRIGTLTYMAPEQITTSLGPAGPKSDIYSLGATLYHLITVRHPFPLGDTSTYEQTEQQILWDRPRRPTLFCKDLNPALETICLKCLQKMPVDRYPTAAALADDLERYLAGRAPLARLPGSLRRTQVFCIRRPIISSAIAIAMVVATGTTGYAWRNHREAVAAISRAAASSQETAHEKEARRVSDLFRYDGQIRSAFQAWNANQPDRAIEFLGQCPPLDRDWEWSYINGLCHAGGTVLPIQDSPLASAAFSDDGLRFATVTRTGTTTVWDTPSGNSICTWNSLASEFSPCRFSTDGKELITCNQDAGKVFRWDAKTGAAIKNIALEDGSFLRDLSHDGKWCLVFGPHNNVPTLTIRETSTAQVITTINPRNFGAARFSSDGSRIIAWSPFGSLVEIFSARTGQKLTDLQNGDVGIVHAVSDGKMVALAFGDGTLSFWNCDSGAEIWTTHPHDGQVTSIALSADGMVLTAARSGPVILTDVQGRRQYRAFRGQTTALIATISPDGKFAVTGGVEPQTLLWHTDTEQAFDSFNAQGAFGLRLALTDDGHTLVTASVLPPCTVWDTKTLREIGTFSRHTDAVTGLAFAGNSAIVWSSGLDGIIRVWNAFSGAEFGEIKCGPEPVAAMALNLDTARLITATPSRRLTLWDLKTTRAIVTRKENSGVIRQIYQNAKTHQIALRFDTGVIEILDDTSLREIKMLPQTAQFSAAAYLAGGAGFVTAAAGQLRLWDPLANQVVRDFVGRSENITAIAPMPDGRRIVTGGSDGTVRLWDMNTGEDLLTLPGAKSEIEALLISADGSSIFAGSDDGRVTTWRIPH